jgi:hypothetical protein
VLCEKDGRLNAESDRTKIRAFIKFKEGLLEYLKSSKNKDYS